MPRGGRRNNAGRKTSWVNTETQVIRVPKVFVPQLMQMAKSLDKGELLDLVTESNVKQGEEIPVRDVDMSVDQLSLLEYSDQAENEHQAVLLAVNPIEPLSCRALSRRIGWARSTIASNASKETFTEESRKDDPEGVGWVFRDKLYHPVL
jgi:hypothetical protein